MITINNKFNKMKQEIIYYKMNIVNKRFNKNQKLERERLIELGDRIGNKVQRKINPRQIQIFNQLMQKRSKIWIILINKQKIWINKIKIK